MRKLLLITATVFATSPALAGNLVFVPEPIAEIVAPVEAWTGPYAGVQVGYGFGEMNGGQIHPVDLSGMLYGAHIGYNFDMGNIVLGAEIDYNLADISGSFDGPANLTTLAHIKARVGFDMGQTMIYGVGGMAYAEMDLFGGSSERSDTGFFGGVGAEHMISADWSAGVEYLFHHFDDFGDTGLYDVDLHTIMARASFHF